MEIAGISKPKNKPDESNPFSLADLVINAEEPEKARGTSSDITFGQWPNHASGCKTQMDSNEKNFFSFDTNFSTSTNNRNSDSFNSNIGS